MKSVRVQSFSGLDFPALGLNMESRKTPNMDIFHVVTSMHLQVFNAQQAIDTASYLSQAIDAMNFSITNIYN